jgi:hypothetical protein
LGGAASHEAATRFGLGIRTENSDAVKLLENEQPLSGPGDSQPRKPMEKGRGTFTYKAVLDGTGIASRPSGLAKPAAATIWTERNESQAAKNAFRTSLQF